MGKAWSKHGASMGQASTRQAWGKHGASSGQAWASMGQAWGKHGQAPKVIGASIPFTILFHPRFLGQELPPSSLFIILKGRNLYLQSDLIHIGTLADRVCLPELNKRRCVLAF